MVAEWLTLGWDPWQQSKPPQLTPPQLSSCLDRFHAVGAVSLSSCHSLASLFPRLPSTLTGLDLSFCYELDDELLQALVQALPRLQTLHLEDCEEVKDAGVIAVARAYPDLTVITLDSLGITDMALAALATHCPRLTCLRLANSPEITDDGVCCLVDSLETLRFLTLRFLPEVTTTGLLQISDKCPLLQSLNLEGCTGVGNIGVWEVARRCTQLRALNLFGCVNVTSEGVEELETIAPHVTTVTPPQGVRYEEAAAKAISVM